jgi:hypothetical protein
MRHQASLTLSGNLARLTPGFFWFWGERLPKKLGQLLANLFFGVNHVPLKMFGCF